jgi:60 kDa SS-A/Ro ribonucleoprotein
MAQINVKKNMYNGTTFEGAPSRKINSELALRRSVLSCLLWENTFYEDGVSIADRIKELVKENKENTVLNLAIEARNKFKLRHVPLLLLREGTRNKMKISDALCEVIQRPDEISEFLAIYWKDGRVPISAQVKKGIADAFNKFNEYSLAKYNRKGKEVSLKDALFLSHAKPKNKEKEILFKKLVEDKLETPDTWEVNLSTGENKKETFTRLIQERKLGSLALLRNLRNMIQAGVDDHLIKDAIRNANYERILPFRFIAAEKYAPQFSEELESVMIKSLKEVEKLEGNTIILVDVSASMRGSPLAKSESRPIDYASALAILVRQISDSRVFVFNSNVKEIPNRRGFALRDSIVSRCGGSTFLGAAISEMNKVGYERLIVITDEQSSDAIPDATSNKSYMINVASYKNGVGYGKWIHIDGFSEAVIDFIIEYEKEFI